MREKASDINDNEKKEKKTECLITYLNYDGNECLYLKVKCAVDDIASLLFRWSFVV